MRLERPFPVYSRGGEKFDLWFGDSPDLRYWGNHQLVLATEQVKYAGDKIGPGAPPVRTDKGWLTLFHTVRIDRTRELSAWHPGWYKTYEIGVMLLDLNAALARLLHAASPAAEARGPLRTERLSRRCAIPRRLDPRRFRRGEDLLRSRRHGGVPGHRFAGRSAFALLERDGIKP
jgi:hypothetical protein